MMGFGGRMKNNFNQTLPARCINIQTIASLYEKFEIEKLNFKVLDNEIASQK